MKKLIFTRKILFTITTTLLLINCSSNSKNYIKDNNNKSQNTRNNKTTLTNAIMPDWINTPPKSNNSYFFVGLGEDNNKAKAKKKAIQDALGQVTLLIHTSINSQNSFSALYKEQENNNNEQFSLEKEAYSKLKIKGQASINNFSIKENYHNKYNDAINWYTLTEIPKKVVEHARKKIISLRKKLENTPAIIVAQNKIKKDTFNNRKLKAFFELFYKSQGYSLIEGNIRNTNIDNIKKEAINKKAKILIYVIIEVNNISKENVFYVVEGSLIAKEIYLNTNEQKKDKIENLYLDSNKGISSQNLAKAFSRLENKLMDKLSNKNTNNNNQDSYISY